MHKNHPVMRLLDEAMVEQDQATVLEDFDLIISPRPKTERECMLKNPTREQAELLLASCSHEHTRRVLTYVRDNLPAGPRKYRREFVKHSFSKDRRKMSSTEA